MATHPESMFDNTSASAVFHKHLEEYIVGQAGHVRIPETRSPIGRNYYPLYSGVGSQPTIWVGLQEATDDGMPVYTVKDTIPRILNDDGSFVKSKDVKPYVLTDRYRFLPDGSVQRDMNARGHWSHMTEQEVMDQAHRFAPYEEPQRSPTVLSKLGKLAGRIFKIS